MNSGTARVRAINRPAPVVRLRDLSERAAFLAIRTALP